MTQDHLEYMIRKWTQEYQKWGLEVNVENTETMWIGGEQQDIILENGCKIPKCQEYTYLVLKITQDGTLETGLMKRIVSYRSAIAMLNIELWKKSISKANKKHL